MRKTNHLNKSQLIGRDEELKIFERLYSSDKSSIVVMYGRRRVGKSSLIDFFARKLPYIKLEGIQGQHSDYQIQHSIQTLKTQINDPLLDSIQSSNWNHIFNFISQRILTQNQEKTVLFFDELQWLAAGRERLVSLIKYFWDNQWRHKNVMLILCGSIASFMVDKVVKSNALYGRTNATICLKGLPPDQAAMMFKDKRAPEEILRYLLIFGGIPKYLEDIDLRRSFNQNINELCFSRSGSLYNEIEKIFFQQFREHNTYLKIVKAVQDKPLSGRQITSFAKLPSGGGITKYIQNLANSEFIKAYERLSDKPERSINKYLLADEYLQFYFKYIKPSSRLIEEEDRAVGLFEKVAVKGLNIWQGFAFERFCLKHKNYLARKLGFADYVTSSGPIFMRSDTSFQVDLAYLRSDKVLTICEIKYHQAPVSTNVIAEVERKKKLVSVPKGHSLETILIAPHGVDNKLRKLKYFDSIMTVKDIL